MAFFRKSGPKRLSKLKIPTDDPRQRLEQATRTTRTAGVIFTLLGLLLAGLAIYPTPAGPDLPFLAFSVLVLLGPGIAYLMLAILLRRLHRWAVPGTIVVASLHWAAPALVYAAALITSRNADPILLLTTILWTLFFHPWIQELSRSFESIRVINHELTRGFEPIMPRPAQPMTPASQRPEEPPQ